MPLDPQLYFGSLWPHHFQVASDTPGVAPCIENISPCQFWSIADRYPNLASRLHVQIRLMGNFGLNGSVPWLTNTDAELCLFAKSF